MIKKVFGICIFLFLRVKVGEVLGVIKLLGLRGLIWVRVLWSVFWFLRFMIWLYKFLLVWGLFKLIFLVIRSRLLLVVVCNCIFLLFIVLLVSLNVWF